MRALKFYAFILLTLSAAAVAQQAFNGPAQAARGHEVFFTTAKPMPCGTCHTMAGKGTAVGPDLKSWSRIAPRAAAMAITSTVTDKVVLVKPKAAAAFPAMKSSEGADGVKYYDLSASPPALRTFAEGEIESTSANAAWKHPPGQERLTGQQLADVIGYIRWAGAQEKKEIKPEDVE